VSDASGTEGGFLPVSKRSLEVLFYLAVLLWVGYLMLVSMEMSYSGKLVPMLVGVPVLLLTAVKLVPVEKTRFTDLFGDTSTESADEPEEIGLSERMDVSGNSPAREQRVAVEMIVWSVALMALVYYFGYYFTLPPYIFALTWYLKRDVRTAIIVTVLFTVVVTFLFIVLFEQLLYRGAFNLPNPTL
jgi:hypothetical protein